MIVEYVALALRFGLASVFAVAGLSKIGDAAGFSRAIAEYRVVPRRLVRSVAWVLPRLEISGGILLALGVSQSAAALVLAGLLMTFSVAVSVNLVRGRRIDCGCLGATGQHLISWGTVTRNVLLAGAAVFVWRWPSNSLTVPTDGPGAILARDALAVMVIAPLIVVVSLLIAEARRVRLSLAASKGWGPERG